MKLRINPPMRAKPSIVRSMGEVTVGGSRRLRLERPFAVVNGQCQRQTGERRCIRLLRLRCHLKARPTAAVHQRHPGGPEAQAIRSFHDRIGIRKGRLGLCLDDQARALADATNGDRRQPQSAIAPISRHLRDKALDKLRLPRRGGWSGSQGEGERSFGRDADLRIADEVTDLRLQIRRLAGLRAERSAAVPPPPHIRRYRDRRG